jgi:hypothetical protein
MEVQLNLHTIEKKYFVFLFMIFIGAYTNLDAIWTHEVD